MLLYVGRDKVDGPRNGLDFPSPILIHLDVEFLLESGDELHDFHRVGAKVENEV